MFFMVTVSFSANAQFKVRFRIVDSEGNPAIGATIAVNGTQIGTISDLDGYVTLIVPSDQSLVSISLIGCETITVPAHQLKGTIILQEGYGSYSSRKPVFRPIIRTAVLRQ